MADNDRPLRSIVIVGGGTAGWMSAAYIAAYFRARRPDLSVTVIEAPDIPTVGVGEGTWPTIRDTLKVIGIPEIDFLLACDASFKQGSRFVGWVDGAEVDYYHHPLTRARPGDPGLLIGAWQHVAPGVSFGEALNAQSLLQPACLAPRQLDTPGYQGILNYSYHLDAGKLATLLTRHAVDKLGVRHVADRMVSVEMGENDEIAALVTKECGTIPGDLFIDCTGFAALLIGKHYGVEFLDYTNTMLNDRALASQVKTLPDSPIASMTISTAQSAGWIWDIALPSRRGIGYVHSSRFCEEAEAEATLRDYIARNVPGADAQGQAVRLLKFPTGFRAEFWHGNCVAIGLSAGFIEPLEASSIVSIEQSLMMLVENLPQRHSGIERVRREFNALFRYRWDRIIDFIKLHYALNKRPEPYWIAQRDPATFSPRLRELLELWRDQPPSRWDAMMQDEIFTFESFQFVYYGLKGKPPEGLAIPDNPEGLLAEVRARAEALEKALPSNRAYFEALHELARGRPNAA